MSPGLIMANQTNPFQDITFDNVVVESPGEEPWGTDFYKCENVEGYVRRGTFPVPNCFVNALDCDIEDDLYCAFGDKCSASSSCEVCSEGFYCEDGETEKVCPFGFTSDIGARKFSDCYEVVTTTEDITTTVAVTTVSQKVTTEAHETTEGPKTTEAAASTESKSSLFNFCVFILVACLSFN